MSTPSGVQFTPRKPVYLSDAQQLNVLFLRYECGWYYHELQRLFNISRCQVWRILIQHERAQGYFNKGKTRRPQLRYPASGLTGWA